MREFHGESEMTTLRKRSATPADSPVQTSSARSGITRLPCGVVRNRDERRPVEVAFALIRDHRHVLVLVNLVEQNSAVSVPYDCAYSWTFRPSLSDGIVSWSTTTRSARTTGGWRSCSRGQRASRAIIRSSRTRVRRLRPANDPGRRVRTRIGSSYRKPPASRSVRRRRPRSPRRTR